MAIKFIEGFETYFDASGQSSSQMLDGWRYSPLYAINAYSTSGYQDGYGLSVQSNTYGFLYTKDLPTIPSGTLSLGIGCRFKTDQSVVGATIIFTNSGLWLEQGGEFAYGIFMYASEVMKQNYISVGWNNDVPEFVYFNQLSYDVEFNDGEWHYVEMIGERPSSDSSTYTYKLKYDGVVVQTASSKTGPSTDQISRINTFGWFGGGWDYPVVYDDVYVVDGEITDIDGNATEISGFVPNAYRSVIRKAIPDVDSTTKDWTTSTGTSHYALVDDIPHNSGDYIYTDTIGNEDVYYLDFSTDLYTVHCVQMQTIAKLDSGTTGELINQVSLRDNSVGMILEPTYKQFNRLYETQPFTNVQWTKSSVNNALIGVKVSGLE